MLSNGFYTSVPKRIGNEIAGTLKLNRLSRKPFPKFEWYYLNVAKRRVGWVYWDYIEKYTDFADILAIIDKGIWIKLIMVVDLNWNRVRWDIC